MVEVNCCLSQKSKVGASGFLDVRPGGAALEGYHFGLGYHAVVLGRCGSTAVRTLDCCLEVALWIVFFGLYHHGRIVVKNQTGVEGS